MEIRKIDTGSRTDIKRFIGFPFGLYQGCQYWVPPMISDMKTIFNQQKHPFYNHSTAEFFIVEQGKEIMGRLAVLNNRPYNEFHGTQTAFFYLFDVVEDIEAARLLFESAFQLVREQGLSSLTGPLGFHQLDGRGILVEGFDFLPATGIPYNYSYYAQILEGLGFEKKTDFLSGVTDNHELPERFYKAKEVIEQRSTFWIKSFSKKEEILLWVPEILGIYNQTYPQLKDHYSMSGEEMNFAVDRLIEIVDPRLIKVIMKDNETVGFVLIYPNIVKGIKRTRGRLWPLGWLHLFWELKTTKRVDFNGIAILPKYQKLGSHTLLYAEIKESLEDFGFQQGEIVQIEEDNLSSLGEAKAIGAVNWRKRHRVYEKTL